MGGGGGGGGQWTVGGEHVVVARASVDVYGTGRSANPLTHPLSPIRQHLPGTHISRSFSLVNVVIMVKVYA